MALDLQIERLQQDSSSLEDFIKRLIKDGNTERAEKIKNKKSYLDQRITKIMEQ